MSVCPADAVLVTLLLLLAFLGPVPAVVVLVAHHRCRLHIHYRTRVLIDPAGLVINRAWALIDPTGLVINRA